MKRLFFSILILSVMSTTVSSCGQEKDKQDSINKYPYTNELIHSSSPYLLEHAHNPVNWYPWGREALDKAKKENKLLIISIGYSACHWCHVMEKQSYSDTTVANYMNAHFVAIKVDREERPDIDQIYMNACQLISGSGGWPLNAFALPDGKPFYAVTYLPKEQWLDLLHQIVKVYTGEPEKVKEQAEALTKGIQGQSLVKQPVDAATGKLQKVYTGLFDSVRSSIDFTHGGFGRAPKFPMPDAWELLLQYYHLKGNEEALNAVTTTLNNMAWGGIYDQLGGGFARYSTDQTWHVPHFEKMLYDNAQLVSLYSQTYKVTHNPLYAAVIRQTLAFIQREMTSPQGAFYSSINADSEGEEGKFYVWTKHETDSLLKGEAADIAEAYYHITANGNWEKGNNILYRSEEDAAFAKAHHLSEKDLHEILQKADKILLDARSHRVCPSVDDKALTSWNALMISGYLDAYHALGDKDYLNAALKCAGFIEKDMMQKDGGLWRNYLNHKPDITGMLDDYAFFAHACIHLYQTTFDIHWLNLAKVLSAYTLKHFYDPQSGLFYYTSDNASHLIARNQEIEDNVLPSSNSVMANVLYRLGIYFDDTSYIDISQEMLSQVMKAIPSGVPYFSNWAKLLGIMQKGPYEVAIMGRHAVEKDHAIQQYYLPDALLMGGDTENLPLLRDKSVKGQTIIYVCENKVCKLPVTEVKDALIQMKR
ncbi:MAG: thioredoxin domain-containing protein [Chitinophagaceae bacterium]|nr:MAG: thioredoxin domain-containing protein [Chitinophagaceae bacterium]